MKISRLGSLVLAGAAATFAFSTIAFGAPDPQIANFKKVWNDKKSTYLDKEAAIDQLPRNKEAMQDNLVILESDVWQFRGMITERIRGEPDVALLKEYETWLFDEKKAPKQPAAAEHVLWALYNNSAWVSADKWALAPKIVQSKAYPDKVKARLVREMGSLFRGQDAEKNPKVQELAKANVKTLVSLLEWSFTEKKFSRELRFLMVDSLEGLTSEEHGDTPEGLEKWKFFADNLKAEIPLVPRKAERFKDELSDVNVEGHSFARKSPRKGGELELLILPDLFKSAEYWYPYVFELNKTFSCTFVDMPDCSRMKDLEWLKDIHGNIDRGGFYYPLAQLVEAFEQRREASGKKRVGIIAHGVSGWIALEYLRLHPESVEFAVVIQTWSGEQSREQARNAMENNREKDPAFSAAGKSLVYRASLTDNEQKWAQTGHIKRRWADHRGLEPLFFSLPQYRVQPQSSAVPIVPKYEFSREMKGKRVDVPVMFVHGIKDPMFVAKDKSVYAAALSKSAWLEFQNSADTPWAEEPVRFFEEFEKFIETHGILERLAKEGNKKNK